MVDAERHQQACEAAAGEAALQRGAPGLELPGSFVLDLGGNPFGVPPSFTSGVGVNRIVVLALLLVSVLSALPNSASAACAPVCGAWMLISRPVFRPSARSMISKVSTPKAATMRLAISGPIPWKRPPPR